MKTLAVMCIALTSTSPSCTPLLRTASSTCGVMFTKAIFEGMLNVRYSVWDFMRIHLKDRNATSDEIRNARLRRHPHSCSSCITYHASLLSFQSLFNQTF